MHVATQSPRKHNRQTTGSAIHEATYCLVKKYGFEATSIDAIAREANTSRRTFFNYFSSKELALYGFMKPSVSEAAIQAYITSTDPILYRCIQLLIAIYTESVVPSSTVTRRSEIHQEYPNIHKQPHEYITLIEELIEPIMQRVHIEPDAAPTELTWRTAGAVLRYCHRIDPDLHETTIRQSIKTLHTITAETL